MDGDSLEKLRSESSDLKGELEAAVTQVEIFRATEEELQGSRDLLEAQIGDLEAKLAALAAVEAEDADRAEAEKRLLEAVAARAAELEGDVSRLQHDLVGAMSECEERAAEADILRKSVIKLELEVKELQGKLLEANQMEQELKLAVEKLLSEKIALENKKNVAESTALELASKLKSLEKQLETVSSENEEQVMKLKSEKLELEEKISSYSENLEKFHLLENGKRSIDDDNTILDHKISWKIMAAGAGTIAALTVTVFFLRHSKNR